MKLLSGGTRSDLNLPIDMKQKEESNQKDGYSSPDGLSCKDVAPVVAVLGYSVDARQHRQANQGQTDKGAGQAPPPGASAAHDVHLNRRKSNVSVTDFSLLLL